ncbi:hypothetical protein CK228_08795 [Mesorhizobium sp. WSM4312]|uniref:hypothetical protein n=1 Tax=Mesorhizobium sp. WSM4312 TaxID=2029411 RepID=UPI000BAF77D8|nr:hypothetical protein [Mesorhizobium sp. WSM4312]PBB69288.1 hypothetical protein CK228_08795 [Mesorhizobium sp. WSM4312]
MADSDYSTTTPSVTHGQAPNALSGLCGPDPAILLLRDWLRAQRVSQVLCRLQQRLERRVLDAAGPEAIDEKVGYTIAYQAEVEATTAALKLQDKLPRIPARSLLGIVAKLEIIAGADRDIDDPTDFPWPHIASVLDDLKKLAGSLPLERPDRSIVQEDCRSYQAIAADFVGLERQATDPHLGRRPAFGINSE